MMDGKEEEERLGGKMEQRGGSEDDDEGGAGYSGGAFAADEESEKHDGLLRDGEMDAGGLGDEDQREGLVKARAIEIETVTGGEHEGDGIARDAEGFQFFHCARESGFGACGGEGDSDGLGGCAEKFLDGHAGE